MRKLIYDVAASLDNFIARPDDSIDGFLTEGAFVADFLDRVKSYGAVLMGRRTYEWGYAHGLQKGQPAYTQINPSLKNYIFSKTLTLEPHDLIDVVDGDEVAFVRNLKNADGNPIWLCGGGELAGSLLDAQLIDELVVKLNPVLLGEGVRLFGASETHATLQLQETKPYDNGLVLLRYQITY